LISRHEFFRASKIWLITFQVVKKYKLSMPRVLHRFREGNTFRTPAVQLIMPTEYKAKRFVAKTWHNPYTAPEKVLAEKARIQRESLLTYDRLWTGYEDRQGWMDLREEVILLKGTTCSTCGTGLHLSEVEIDHIKPRAQFKDPRDADGIANLHILCTLCHRAKTKADLKVLRRMR
jgi:HNH endonuclease